MNHIEDKRDQKPKNPLYKLNQSILKLVKIYSSKKSGSAVHIYMDYMDSMDSVHSMDSSYMIIKWFQNTPQVKIQPKIKKIWSLTN